MKQILTLVAHGQNLAGSTVSTDQVTGMLQVLERNLAAQDLKWSDVALLILANSKLAPTNREQTETDQSIIDGLETFCADRNWYPSLIGSSVLSSFFKSGEAENSDVSDGITFIAVVSGVLDRIPVAVEITREKADRGLAGARALEKVVSLFQAQMRSELNTTIDEQTISQTCTGVLFTMGSGHTEAQEFIDFKDCYAVGQELIEAADKFFNAEVIGGCATNRSQHQLQCLYYSTESGRRIRYRYTQQHAAVMTLLPYLRATLVLQHPYKRVDGNKLDLKFNSHEQYSEGRSFLIETINGQEPVDFLSEAWGFSPEAMDAMVASHTAIPVEPKAHLVTFASSLSKWDTNIWPNVPIWLERVDGQVMLRLVRAEAEDSNFYLMELRPNYLRENAQVLMDAAEGSQGGSVSTLAFLCESRKYVLWDHGSNSEAEEMLSRSRVTGPVIGIYLNGEYSTGSRQSIGYHNYSSIGAFLPPRTVNQLPVDILQARQSKGVELFVCHASRDKSDARAFIAHLEAALPSAVRWIDERNLLPGMTLKDEIKRAIGKPNQAFIPYITDRSVKSSWVQQELAWALAEEGRTHDTFIFPVVIDDNGNEVMTALRDAWGPDLVEVLNSRLYVKVNDYTEAEIKGKALLLAEGIRAWAERRRGGGWMPGLVGPE